MRIGYLLCALVSLVSLAMSIFLVTSPRWIIDYRQDGSHTNYGLFVYEICPPPGPQSLCIFVFYPSFRSHSLYSYYKAGAVGGAFLLTGMILYLVFMIFMFIKAFVTGMAGRCLHRVFNNYYGLYYLGLVAVFLQALGWGLYSRIVPHTYKFRYPFWLCLINWICIAVVVLAIFARKIIQGNAKKGGWMSIS